LVSDLIVTQCDGDVDGRSPEVASEVGFILYVRDGLIDVLEGHAYAGEDWPKREEEIELFSEFFTRHHDGGIPYAPLA
jgi:hypothetical protein